MHSGTVFQFKSLLNMPKNPIHPEEKGPRVSSAAVVQHFQEQSSGAENMKCYFRVFFKAVIFSKDKQTCPQSMPTQKQHQNPAGR